MGIVEDDRFIQGTRHFDDRDFAEAADVFEELYFEYTMEERELARAMMQLRTED